jgi:hypothetical protein
MTALVAVQTTVLMALRDNVARRRIFPRPHLGQAWRDHASPALEQHRDPGCPGILRFVDLEHAIPLAECDRCGYELAVKR